LQRCWGLNRNLRRCCRQGDWKFLCDDHHNQPLVAIFIIVFTVLAGVASIQSAWFPNLWKNVHRQEMTQHPVAPTPTPVTTVAPTPSLIEQKATESTCSNVVAGGNAKIDCPSAKENGSAKKHPNP
jgi:hypothetical protein